MPDFMHPENPSPMNDAFLAVAQDQSLLSAEDARHLYQFANSKSLDSSEAALQTGMLKPVEVEIVEAFTSPEDLAPGYSLKNVLGHGALGIVYRAYQSRLQRDVAIKSIIESRVSLQNVIARFEQEGTAIGRLKHPNIVRAYDSGCHNNRLYLVMELVEGQDLRQKLESGALDPQTSLWILRQTAMGLAHAKSHEIIHRDIKPGNLLLTEAPAGFDLPEGIPLVKIADFGLAQLNEEDETDAERTHLTLVGATMGTPMYSAPEQLSGEPIDHRTDIYALGATLFQMLAGDTPYASGKITKLFSAKANGTPPRLELLPKKLAPAIVDLIIDLMQHDPEKRIADYPELISRIDEILQQMSSATHGHVGSSRRHRARFRTKTKQTSSVWAWVNDHMKLVRAVGVVILALTLFAIVINPPSFLRVPLSPSLVPDGWEQPLFDGKTLIGFQSPEGLWLAANDSEGGAVLSGQGSIARPLPIPPNPNAENGFGFGCRVGVDLRSATQTELHFGFADSSLDDCERYVLRYNRGTASFGTCTGRDGEFHRLSIEVSTTDTVPNNALEGTPNYAQLAVELHNAQWFVFFNGGLLGNVGSTRGSNRDIIEFVTRGGTARFEAPSVYRLVEKAPVSR
jgi:serine/threonine protein kinase